MTRERHYMDEEDMSKEQIESFGSVSFGNGGGDPIEEGHRHSFRQLKAQLIQQGQWGKMEKSMKQEAKAKKKR